VWANAADGTSEEVVFIESRPTRLAKWARKIAVRLRENSTLLDGPESGIVDESIRFGMILGMQLAEMARWYDGTEQKLHSKSRSVDALKSENRSKANKATRLREEAIEALAKAEQAYPDRASDVHFLKLKAAESLGITRRAFNLRLRKGRNENLGK
jgi:hypothetical protein